MLKWERLNERILNHFRQDQFILDRVFLVFVGQWMRRELQFVLEFKFLSNGRTVSNSLFVFGNVLLVAVHFIQNFCQVFGTNETGNTYRVTFLAELCYSDDRVQRVSS